MFKIKNPILSLLFSIISSSLYRYNFLGAAAIIGGATLVSGYLGSKATGKAAGQSADAAQRGVDEQARQFDITQEQYKPFREAGLRGLSKYENLANQEQVGNIPSSFSYTAEDFATGKDPGYEFRRSEGLRALDRVMGRRGQLGSGARYRGLMDLGQNLASAEFGAARGRAFQDYSTQVSREQEQYQRGYVDPMNRYAGLAGIGQSATTGLAGLRGNYASNVSNLYGQQGQAQAAGTLGQAGAWTGVIQSGMGLYGMSQFGGLGGGGGTAGASSAPGGGSGLYSMGGQYQANNPVNSIYSPNWRGR